MIDSGNYERIRALLAENPRQFVPVPARYMVEMLLDGLIDTWRDPETGVDKIESVVVAFGRARIVVNGEQTICAYEPEDNVLVANKGS